jgi:hypothetical protein
MAYFSNSCEGDTLDNQCAECPVGKNPNAPCPVLLAQLHWNYKQFTNGKPNEIADILNVLVDKNGVCQMKPLIDDPACKEPFTTRRKILPSMVEWAEKHKIIPKSPSNNRKNT